MIIIRFSMMVAKYYPRMRVFVLSFSHPGRRHAVWLICLSRTEVESALLPLQTGEVPVVSVTVTFQLMFWTAVVQRR